MFKVHFKDLLWEKENRDKTRYTVADIARETGVSRQTVYVWLEGEIGQIRFDVLEKFVNWLDCRPSELVQLDPDPEHVAPTAVSLAG